MTVSLPRRTLRPGGYVTCASPHSHFFWQSRDEGSYYFTGCHFGPSGGFSCEGETPIPILEFLRGSPTARGGMSHCGPRGDARGIIYSRRSGSLRIWASLSGVCVAQYFPHRVPSSSYAIIVESGVRCCLNIKALTGAFLSFLLGNVGDSLN